MNHTLALISCDDPKREWLLQGFNRRTEQMHSFSTVRRPSIYACLLLLVSLVSEGANSAASDEPEGALAAVGTIPIKEFEWHRPPDFFRHHINLDPEVCDQLLDSLNKPYDPRPDDRPSVTLLHNEFLVPWRDKKYVSDATLKEFGTTTIQVWPQIVGDLDGDGNTDAVYRTSLARKTVFFDFLYFSPSPQPDELSDEVMGAGRYQALHGEIVVGSTSSPQYGHPSNELVVSYERLSPHVEHLRGFGNFQDVVQIRGKYYLLYGSLPALTDLGDPEQVNSKYLATVTLVSMHPGQNFEPKCQFLATKFLLSKGR